VKYTALIWKGLEAARDHECALYLDCAVTFYWIADHSGTLIGGGHVFTDHHFSHHHKET
jgi:hypothetical protein